MLFTQGGNMNKLILGLLLVVISGSLYAGDSSSGCGMGWTVFKKNSLISSSLRASTNATFLNSVGMTLGTSGCAKHSIVKNDAKGIHFAESNFHQLLVEASKGLGEHLDGLAYSLGKGCVTGEFSKFMQNNYETIFDSQTNGTVMFHKVKKMISNEKSLQKNCAII
jgi:hypothetical protein